MRRVWLCGLGNVEDISAYCNNHLTVSIGVNWILSIYEFISVSLDHTEGVHCKFELALWTRTHSKLISGTLNQAAEDQCTLSMTWAQLQCSIAGQSRAELPLRFNAYSPYGRPISLNQKQQKLTVFDHNVPWRIWAVFPPQTKHTVTSTNVCTSTCSQDPCKWHITTSVTKTTQSLEVPIAA